MVNPSQYQGKNTEILLIKNPIFPSHLKGDALLKTYPVSKGWGSSLRERCLTGKDVSHKGPKAFNPISYSNQLGGDIPYGED